LPYDPTTDIGKVRLQIADTGSSPIFSDAEIQAFLDQETGSIMLASADALDALAALYARRSTKLRRPTFSISRLCAVTANDVLVSMPRSRPSRKISLR